MPNEEKGNPLGQLLTNSHRIELFSKEVAAARDNLDKLVREAPPLLPAGVYKQLLEGQV